MGHFLKAPTSEPAWTFPPNTLLLFGTQECSDSKDSVGGLDYFHYLYLRVKRGSKYWDNQWDDIIREATEHLNHTDDQSMEHGECPEGQVIGAFDPYVILTVGLEVRLFKWEQGFDETIDEEARRKTSPFSILRELNPEKPLNIYEKGDTEEIEEFLEKAEQQKESIKARESEKYGGKKE